MPKVRHPSPEHEHPCLWTVLDRAMTTPRASPRLALLLLLPLAALVAVVALVAIYLGPVGVGAVLGTTSTVGYVAQRIAKRRRGGDAGGTTALAR